MGPSSGSHRAGEHIMVNKIPPFSVCWVSTEPSVSARITYLRPPRISGGRYQYPHFLEEKTEAQTGEVSTRQSRGLHPAALDLQRCCTGLQCVARSPISTRGLNMGAGVLFI